MAQTPEPPYYAVIFTSTLTADADDYGDMADRMMALAADQPGFLGADSAREDVGITVSYWTSLESITAWKRNSEHLDAQRKGREVWYQQFKMRISKVEREYGFSR